MDGRTSSQIRDMKDKLYEAFTRASASEASPEVEIATRLSHLAQGYAALAQADFADTQNMVRARVAGFELSWEKK